MWNKWKEFIQYAKTGFKFDWSEEEKQMLAPDVVEPTKDFHSNWRILYYKLLDTREELYRLTNKE